MQLKERWCYDKVRNTAPDLLKKLLQIFKKKLLRIYIKNYGFIEEKKNFDLLKKKQLRIYWKKHAPEINKKKNYWFIGKKQLRMFWRKKNSSGCFEKKRAPDLFK